MVLTAGSFDRLCEQGHVGLERVAKARRDPALVEPVKAAVVILAAIYARLGGDVSVLHAGRLRPPPRRAHRIRIGEPLMSVIATLTVPQRAHLTRTLSVIWIACIDAASTVPQLTHT
jgi:hypothetical protein